MQNENTTFPKVVRILESGILPMGKLVTHQFGLEEFGGVVELLRQGQTVKTVLSRSANPPLGRELQFFAENCRVFGIFGCSPAQIEGWSLCGVFWNRLFFAASRRWTGWEPAATVWPVEALSVYRGINLPQNQSISQPETRGSFCSYAPSGADPRWVPHPGFASFHPGLRSRAASRLQQH